MSQNHTQILCMQFDGFKRLKLLHSYDLNFSDVLIFSYCNLSVLIGPPTAPERFMYTERTKSSITLDWKPPRSDGGSPILGYIVEKRRHDSKDYERVNARLCPKTSLLVEKLDELHMYEFRVKAVNEIGESEPSLPLNVVIQDDEGMIALKKSI